MACLKWRSTFLFHRFSVSQNDYLDQSLDTPIRKGAMTTTQAETFMASYAASHYPNHQGTTYTMNDMSYVYKGKQVCQKSYMVLVKVA